MTIWKLFIKHCMDNQFKYLCYSCSKVHYTTRCAKKLIVVLQTIAKSDIYIYIIIYIRLKLDQTVLELDL
jgi:hypothetical protein